MSDMREDMEERITLWHGDCLELLKNIPDNSIDMVLTDPPYGTTACKWDTVIPFEPMWHKLKRITKDNGAICLFGSEPFSSHLRLSNLKMFKYDWIWHKSRPTGFALAKKQPMRTHEIISVFYSKQANYNSIKEPRDANKESINRYKYEMSLGTGTNKVNGGISNQRANIEDIHMRNATTVKYFKSMVNCKLLHPTQKPVKLLEYLIKTYTLENETVLDFTMGSGSTGVAAKNLNRKFIGIEKEEKYFDIAKERIENA